MIPYEDLCRALDIHNRKLRGEDVPEEAYQEQAVNDDFDIVDSEEAGAMDMQEGYVEATPDVTAETAIPDADYGEQQPASGEYAEGAYDSGAVPAPPAEAMYDSGAVPAPPAEAMYDSGAVPGQPAEGMTSDQLSSGQQYQEGYEQPAEQPVEQQYQEGYEQPVEQAPVAHPDNQDPNQQQ